ncbi:hypothetical protein NHX12_017786 [Muraenolepis orangiensis]|uniref:Nuclear pore complex protein Nup133 n=1 Tax=Muraenolepis orangiensis TaxID=630683 RepID=A0A9Q0EVD6_9TELE|nr:hypothetical protein NHX12_017786 [Muraenolepis orangiensis]
MFTRGTPPGSVRRQFHRNPVRKSLSGTPPTFLFSPLRTSSLASRSNSTRVPSQSPAESVNYYDVQTFGSSLPVKVMEALTHAEPDDHISVKVGESGWAWMVCGELLIIWKICQTVVAKLCVCKELQLPLSEHEYTADLVAIGSPGPLETAPVQSISVLAVAPEGGARYWASLANEGNYIEAELSLGDLCNFVVAVKGATFVVSSSSNQLLRVSVESFRRLGSRALQRGQGMLSGISKRVSSLFGMTAPPTNETLHSMVWACKAGCLYTLTSSSVCRWEVEESSEQQTLSWNSRCSLNESIADAIWGSESNYEEMKEGVNVSYLDMKLSQSGLVLLVAAWHSLDTPCIAYFCLVTLQDHTASVFDHITLEVTKHTAPFQTEEALRTTRLVVPNPGSTAFLYTPGLVFACSTGTGRGGPPDEKIPFSAPGDCVCGGGCCDDLPIFFSKNSGLVAVVARETVSILPETMEQSLSSSFTIPPEVFMMETPTKLEAIAHENKTQMLKAAFLQFCRDGPLAVQVMVDELFPPEAGGEGEEGAELDDAVIRINLDLVDDYPASDPRWAETVPKESVCFNQSSLIIYHQLEDKLKAHLCLMDFLLQTGLLQRLGQIKVRGAPMATRLLLCEHAEMLRAALALKSRQTKHSELVNPAIAAALRLSGAVGLPSLTPTDIFFREVSQVSLVFECLLEEERSLIANSDDSAQWTETVLNVNNIIKDMLQAAVQYRESSASLYRVSDMNLEPEFIPWTASGVVRGVISRQHEVILRSVYPYANSELRGVLCEQLVDLLDLYLGGYVAQLASLQPRTQGRPIAAKHDRYNALELEYCQRRSELIAPLLELGQYQWVATLSEKFCDFDMLVQMCEQSHNLQRLEHYMTKFADQNFSDFVFRSYIAKGQRGKLLSQSSAHHDQLATFLQSHQHLSWLHHILVHDYKSAHETLQSQANGETHYFSKKKTLLALSKLSALASDLKQSQLRKQLDDIVEQERFLLHQETLPKQLLKEKDLDSHTMPLLTPHDLITLYISEDNTSANEYDFKKALDLLEYIKEEDGVDTEALKLKIFATALKKDDWCSWDDGDDPLEPARDTLFVKILFKLIQEGVSLQAYLPDAKELLDSELLIGFRSTPYFEFVLRANYEHYLKVQI